MKLLIYISFVTVLLFSYCACTNNDNIECISKAAEIVYSNPDSAQYLLAQIDIPEKLSQDQYSEYILTQTKINRCNNISLKSDTLILKAVDYFSQTGNTQKLAEAYLEAGHIFEDQDSIDLASALYQKALEITRKIGNDRLRGFSAYAYGELLEDQKQYKEAIALFEESKESFQKINSKRFEINSFRKIADNYVLDDNVDKAIAIYEESLNILPEKYKDLKTLILKNIAVAHSKGGDQEKAKFYIQESIGNSPSIDLYPIQHLILSDIFRAQNQIDSADYYQASAFKYATELNDPSLLYFAYETRLDKTQRKERYLKARYDYWLYRNVIDFIHQKPRYQSMKYVVSLYNQEKIKRKDQELTIQKQRFYFGSTIVIFIAITLFLAYYQRKKKHIQYLYTDIENKKNKIDSTKSVLLEKLNIYKKMTSWYLSVHRIKYQKLLDESNKLFFEDDNDFTFNIEIVAGLVNDIHDNFVDNLKNTYPELKEIETNICILFKAGYNVNEIAELLNKTVNTIYKYNSNIRKKIGVPENRHILDYLDAIFQK